jgi:hypothetical protein
MLAVALLFEICGAATMSGPLGNDWAAFAAVRFR